MGRSVVLVHDEPRLRQEGAHGRVPAGFPRWAAQVRVPHPPFPPPHTPNTLIHKTAHGNYSGEKSAVACTTPQQ